MRPADDQSTANRRLTVQEAASVLGITVDAVRGRIKRGSLESGKGDDGTVYVLVGEDEQAIDQPDGQPKLVADQSQLVEHMQDQIDYLRRQLAVWQEEARRKDHIIAALTERIPAIEAPTADMPSEPRGSATEATQGPEGVEAPLKAERRSWWRKLFG
jgi:hypothetical protein